MQASKRGQRVALAGLVLQLILVGLATGLSWTTGSPALRPALWLLVAPLPLWVITLLLFYCRYLQRREADELDQLAARGEQAESIFQDEQGQLRPAANRLRWMQRYMVPAFTLLLAGYHIIAGIVLLRWIGGLETAGPTSSNAAAMFFSVGGAFVAFLFSRYAVGMAEGPEWRLLRAPGSYLFMNALVFGLLAGVLGAEYYKSPTFGLVVAYVLPAFAIIIGAELVLNFVLDLYRPRVPGGEVRYSYDSRLLDLIANPQSIGHSIAEAMNYQFGFEVSGTWFYRLLQRALVPLLLTGAVIVWLMTSVVVVEEGEQYVVLHWGKRYPQRLLTPRPWPYLIWPWPIDTARKFQTDQIHHVTLGVGAERTEEFINEKRVYLWTEEHGDRNELDTLVAIPPGAGKRRHEDAPSVSLIKLVMTVYYRIGDEDEDIYRFGYNFTDAPRLLEAIAYREMIRYAASATLDEPLPAGKGKSRPQGILSFGRADAAKELKKRIAAAIDRQDMGVRIVRVELLGCHPPKEAAPSFEDVIAAERQQDKHRYQAQAEANWILSAVAGDPDKALMLSQTIGILQELEGMSNTRHNRGDVAAAVSKAIERTREEIARLEKQLHVERLLGRHRPRKKPAAGLPPSPAESGASTAAQELLARRKEHLALLEGIQADPAGYDLAGAIAEVRKEVDGLFDGIQGDAAVTIAQARAQRWKTEFRERARAETFQADLLGLRAAPSLYRLDKYLNVLTEGLRNRRKYVLGMDRNAIVVWVNLEEQLEGLGDIPLGEE